ncbi:MAG: mechanosensitive ion channel, partial [Rickettsiales bacterium]|nr:mechanosensitive ion channel [Rickettsiales bacterium]
MDIIEIFQIESLIEVMRQWFHTYIMDWNVLLQVTVSVCVYAIAYKVAEKPKQLLDEYLKGKFTSQTLDKYNEEALINSIQPLTNLILQWLAILLAIAFELQHGTLLIIAKLLTAWVIIRSTSSLIRVPALSRIISIIAWSITALSITDTLTPTVEQLDKVAVEFGDFRFSALLVIKGIITFFIAIWVASFASRVFEHKVRNMNQITPSVRVLINKIGKTLIFTIAVIVVIDSLGIDLTALTVFGGAIGLGLGFGLQKVVSNLVSGLILLVDRSVKPGDVIEVGGTYGWVNSLGARHISILTRDGVEHLIPNEHLITEKVVNWSYTSSNIRLKIPIGVSYNSDVHKAMEIITGAAKAHSRVLNDPEPVARLLGFGDSAVNLELRIWIN